MVFNTAKRFVDPGKREEGMDLQMLFGVECVDEVALQTMLHQHPSRAAGKIPAGSGSKNQRMVNGLLDVERRGG